MHSFSALKFGVCHPQAIVNQLRAFQFMTHIQNSTSNQCVFTEPQIFNQRSMSQLDHKDELCGQ